MALAAQSRTVPEVPSIAAPRTGGWMRDAEAALRIEGCVILRQIFAPSLIAALQQEFLRRYGGLDASAMEAQANRPRPNRFLRVGDARYEITIRMDGVFATPELFASEQLHAFLVGILGEDMRLSGCTIVVSHPGASLQHVHRDHAHLYADPGLGPRLPCYAVNVAVPLVDVDERNGPTMLWPGSHCWPATIEPLADSEARPTLRRGDAMLLDYRLFHAGMPNRGERPRPMLYMPYTRTWFFDEVNHVGRKALDMPLEVIRAQPESLHPLLVRAFSHVTHERWSDIDL